MRQLINIFIGMVIVVIVVAGLSLMGALTFGAIKVPVPAARAEVIQHHGADSRDVYFTDEVSFGPNGFVSFVDRSTGRIVTVLGDVEVRQLTP